MFNIIGKIAVSMLGALLLAACVAQPRYHDRYDDRTDARHDQRYDDRYSARSCDTCGTIESIDEVWVRQRSGGTGGGVVLGAIIGGVLGNQVGSGRGRDAATVAGAVAGGVVGHQIENNRGGEQRGYRFEVRLDNGRWAEVTQLNHDGLRVGDQVLIRQQQLIRRN